MFVPKGPIDNKWALVQIMDCRRTGDKPLPEPMLTLRRQDTSSHDIDYVEWVGPCLISGMISTTCVISMQRNDVKCKYMFYVSSEKFST